MKIEIGQLVLASIQGMEQECTISSIDELGITVKLDYPIYVHGHKTNTVVLDDPSDITEVL